MTRGLKWENIVTQRIRSIPRSSFRSAIENTLNIPKRVLRRPQQESALHPLQSNHFSPLRKKNF